MAFPFECQQSVITQKSQVREASTDCPNQKWAGDISYIWTSEGWLYLAVILDL
ncbi:MAG: transposase InsO family protein [bacterium]|jgi:transposase InsO family protein